MLAPGTLVGPYNVIALLGTGGMGEVYRASDTRLGREVALKVLSPHLAVTPEIRARFEREARTVSQLNHPHICALYDVGRQGDMDYLVMELVEGETLARRLERGPLPVGEVLALGSQVAEALDKAHRSGVVHRDLKPGNIMLTAGGAKLMDFGLARAAVLAPAAAARADSPTLSRPLTAEGTIVGTFQYMAPEQLEGKEIDARADIWALGCVLYEMATGRRAFEGDSQASLIAAIMDREPQSITALKPMSPPALDHVVKRCLAKDPAERWQSARDVVHEFRWIAEVGSQAGVPAPVVVRRRRRERLAWGLALGALAIAVAASAALLAIRASRRPPEPALVRFSITAPSGWTAVPDPSTAMISPDGRKIVFTVTNSSGAMELCVRPLDSLSAQILPGTENAFLPFWSPDSRYVAFFAEGKLQKIQVPGGRAETICAAPSGRGGTWSKDGVIVFAPQAMGPLLRVPAEGGEVVEVARPDPARHETGLRFPRFLPDGRHFLYVSLPRKKESLDVYIGSLDSQDRRRVMEAGEAPLYAEPGFLLFILNSRVVAQRFDLSGLKPFGEIVTLGDAPPVSQFEGSSRISISANGILAHVRTTLPDTKLIWLDRSGRSTGSVNLLPGCYTSPSLSPDGRRAVVFKWNPPTGYNTWMTGYDIWMIDLQSEVATRLTFEGMAAGGGGMGSSALWSPDGARIAFQQANGSGIYNVCQVLASGAGRPELLVPSEAVFSAPAAWSPDGRYLVYDQNDEGTGWDLWLLPLAGDRTPQPYLQSPFDEMAADISPDGRWLAYDSDETGTPEIYVSSFPEPGEKHRISTSGGTVAQWSKDGRELLIFKSGTLFTIGGSIFTVDVQTAPSFKASPPRLLFVPRQDILGITATADLKRFLATVPVDDAPPPGITVTLNWQTALKR
jgi:Tol biopolymer transport system component